MRKASLLVPTIALSFILAVGCMTQTDQKASELDEQVFELVIRSVLDEVPYYTRYTEEKLLVSGVPLSEKTAENQMHAIQEGREQLIARLGVKAVDLEKYNSCKFHLLVPPLPSGKQPYHELPEYCHEFENKFALTASVPQKYKGEDKLVVDVQIFSNHGYEYYRFIISNTEKPRVLDKVLVGWVTT